jgi:hypothetical protein
MISGNPFAPETPDTAPFTVTAKTLKKRYNNQIKILKFTCTVQKRDLNQT